MLIKGVQQSHGCESLTEMGSRQTGGDHGEEGELALLRNLAMKQRREVRSQERECESENFFKMGNRITHVYVIYSYKDRNTNNTEERGKESMRRGERK